MDPDALRHVVLIETYGTFTAAAQAAHLSQPALSASIQRLEAALGARLFERGPGARGGARLTAAGRALLPHAKAILGAMAEAARAVADVGEIAGEVRLAAGATACTYLLPEIVAAFRQRHPAVVLTVREANTPVILKAVESGEADLGVITGPGQDHWRADPLVLVAGPGSPYAALRDPEALGRAPLVAFHPSSPLRAISDRVLPEAPVVMSLTNIAAVKGNVRAGVGVALVSAAAVAHDVEGRRLVILPHPATPVARALSLAHRGEKALPPAVAALRRALLAVTPSG